MPESRETLSERIAQWEADDKQGYDIAIGLLCEARAALVQMAEERDIDIARLTLELQNKDRQSWRCFHCEEVFTDPLEACEHFGHDELIGTAICRTEATRLRELEDSLESFRRANEQLDHEAGCYHAYQGELERYFGKGASTPHQAWLRFEEKEGEIEVLQAALTTLQAQQAEQRKALENLVSTWQGIRTGSMIRAEGIVRCAGQLAALLSADVPKEKT